jgi:hypothetical protein
LYLFPYHLVRYNISQSDGAGIGGMPSGFSVDPMLTAPGTGSAVNDPHALNTLSAYKFLSMSPMIDTGLALNSLFVISPGGNDF